MLVVPLVGSARKVVIKFKPTKDEIITKPQLKGLFASNPRPSILLRVPNPTGSISQSHEEGRKYLDIDMDRLQFYSYIEKRLMKAGFVIRDRAIFEKVLSLNQDVGYSRMQELTNTDFVLEVVNISPQEYHTNEVLKVNSGDMKTYNCNFGGFYGYRVDFRLVHVKTNEVVGMYTFHKTPCTEGCEFSLGHSCNLVSPKVKAKDKDGKPLPFEYRISLYGLDLEKFANDISDRMIKEMK